MSWLEEVTVDAAERRARGRAAPLRELLAALIASASAAAVVVAWSPASTGTDLRATAEVAAGPPAEPTPLRPAETIHAHRPPSAAEAAAAPTPPARPAPSAQVPREARAVRAEILASDVEATAPGAKTPEAHKENAAARAPSVAPRVKDADAHTLRALSLERSGRLTEAIASYAEALADDPAARTARERLVRLLLADARLEEAERWSGEALERWPGDPLWLRLHGEALVLSERAPLAIALVEQQAAPLPEALELHAWAAALQLRAGDARAARIAYERILPHDTGDARWWLGLGLALESEGRVREAAAVYRKALRAERPLAAEARRFVRARAEALSEQEEAS